MGTGCRTDEKRSCCLGIGMFVDQGGYTSVAVATALLVSVALVLCVASAEWTLSRSGDVQQVADATAMAGSNVVARFYTVAQVLDACVLSMGLVGMTVLGAGLVLSATPGVRVLAGSVIDEGMSIMRARNAFAQSAAEGLSRLEAALPLAIVANSWSCASANAGSGLKYAGVALPLPMESHSDYGSLSTHVDAEEVAESAEHMQEYAQACEEAKARADEARERAWRADCMDSPRCLRTRAESLAGLVGVQNPYAPSPESWSFGMAILRSRAYYAARLARESPTAPDIESVTDSLARGAYYRYALGEVESAWYREYEDGSVDLYVPHLACTKNEVKQTWLYTDPSWPCTGEPAGRTLHSCLDCPNALGPYVGNDSVSSVDSGATRLCDACRMDVGDLGAVASISTIADNGYEHYWEIIVQAARDYSTARNEQAEAERRMRESAEEGRGMFQRVLDQLAVPRPHIQPAGSWGCVGIVLRDAGAASPTELTSSPLQGTDLPRGAAVSAATLAPDESTKGNNVLARFFDGLAKDTEPSYGGILGGILTLWGDLLVSYGTAYEGIGSATSGFLGKMDGIFGGTVGSWLRTKVGEVMRAVGLEPADMRLRKPVLVSTSDVLGKAGMDSTGKIRSIIQAFPTGGSAQDIAMALGAWTAGQGLEGKITVAELPLLGTSKSIPLSIDLSTLGGG